MDGDTLKSGLEMVLAGSLQGVDVLTLRRLATFVGTNEETAEIIDRLDDTQYSDLQEALVAEVARKREEEEADQDDERGKWALRLLINIGQRSKSHAGSLPVSVLPSLRDLLIASRHVAETAAILTMAARELATSAALDQNLDTIVAAMAHLWMRVEDDSTRSWISAFMAKMEEVDAAFLANAFGELPPSVFTLLLYVTEALSEGLVVGGRRGDEFRMHPNNVQMLIDIVKRACYDYSDEAMNAAAEAQQQNRFLPEYPNQLPLLLSIIGNLATRRDLFNEVFSRLDNLDLVEAIVELLDVSLHAEGEMERSEEGGAKMTSSRPEDRPEKAKAFSSPRVMECTRLSRLAAAMMEDEKRERARERLGALKCAAVTAIGNLACECEESRLRAGRRDAVILCLAAARRQQHDDPFVTQWSIATLRHLCMGCAENQERLAAIDSVPTGIIDRDNLLAQLGMRVITEEGDEPGTKNAKLVPL